MSNITNYNLNRRIRQILYALKKAFGSTIVLYKLEVASTNYTTGIKSSTTSSITIPRCIVLPVRLQREIIQSIAQISANKMFAYGGSFDGGTREFVIDARDLPSGYNIDLDDYLVYDNRRYDIKNIEILEQRTGWHLTGRLIVKDPVYKEAGATTTLNFTESFDNE
jgi:hypothetical protein